MCNPEYANTHTRTREHTHMLYCICSLVPAVDHIKPRGHAHTCVSLKYSPDSSSTAQTPLAERQKHNISTEYFPRTHTHRVCVSVSTSAQFWSIPNLLGVYARWFLGRIGHRWRRQRRRQWRRMRVILALHKICIVFAWYSWFMVACNAIPILRLPAILSQMDHVHTSTHPHIHTTTHTHTHTSDGSFNNDERGFRGPASVSVW